MAVEFSFTQQDLEEVRDSCSLLSDANVEVLYRDSEIRISSLQQQKKVRVMRQEGITHSAATEPTSATHSRHVSISSPKRSVASPKRIRSELSIGGGT